MEEWRNPKNPNEEIKKLSKKLSQLSTQNISNSELFSEFKKWTNESGNEMYMKLFEAQYPLFNYKSSCDNSFTDISKGTSTNQKYGDYSMIGLNGGSDNITSY
ncbi:hypothetical protein [Spiroplasma endosymbiont of Atherix ibis]|uniref:hypothetical protein n=1 Tax=Spiroplasma endosymbiont of Atherix ibis TaxID=3066291 RepID=UPI0030D2B369